MKTEFISAKRVIILLLATLFSGSMLLWLPYEAQTNRGIALLILVAILWLTEVIPITITALAVPILSIFLGLVETKPALQHFANPTIFLFFGGFALATSLSVNGLDRYIAHKVLSLARGNLLVAILLLFLVTALLSMGISNTATAAMMIPLGVGLLKGLPYEENKKAYWFVILGITYSSSIGGMGTLVGSPPNAIVSSNLHITFQEWLWYGMPVVAGLLPLTIIFLYFFFRPNLKDAIISPKGEQTHQVATTLGKKQWAAIVIFVLTALFWVFSTQINPVLSGLFGLEKIADFDSVIAMTAAILVCVFNVVSWKQIQENTDWGPPRPPPATHPRQHPRRSTAALRGRTYPKRGAHLLRSQQGDGGFHRGADTFAKLFHNRIVSINFHRISHRVHLQHCLCGASGTYLYFHRRAVRGRSYGLGHDHRDRGFLCLYAPCGYST